MLEILEGKRLFCEKSGGVTDIILLGSIYEITGFHLKAYDEFEVYFNEPIPFLELDLTSAAVIARTKNNNSILLVEFGVENGRRVELPAGKVQEGTDKTIIDTAVREFIEETGGVITLPNLVPLSVVPHKDWKGGIQFYTEVPKLKIRQDEELGRGYITPPKGTDGSRVIQLITEPLSVFLDNKKTLLRYSRNPWATDEIFRLTLGMYITKLDAKRK